MQSYGDQIKAALRRAIKFARLKRHDALAVLYYQSKGGTSACASWETFKGSWAGQQWIAQQTGGF